MALQGSIRSTYNIIDIKDGKIDVTIKVVGGKRMPLSNVVKKYEPEVRNKILSK